MYMVNWASGTLLIPNYSYSLWSQIVVSFSQRPHYEHHNQYKLVQVLLPVSQATILNVVDSTYYNNVHVYTV